MERATKALLEKGISREVTTLPESTRTAVDAAAAVGCSVAQIAKSLVFKGAESARPVMVVASGANRVDVAKVGALLGERVAKPDADYVREKTGYAIGGVAPVGHREVMPVLLDEDLFQLEVIWAAAGSPNSVFRITPDTLQRITNGRKVSIA